MKNLEIPDPNDPIFANHDSDFDISQRLDTLSSYSEIYQRRMEKGIPREKLIDNERKAAQYLIRLRADEKVRNTMLPLTDFLRNKTSRFYSTILSFLGFYGNQMCRCW